MTLVIRGVYPVGAELHITQLADDNGTFELDVKHPPTITHCPTCNTPVPVPDRGNIIIDTDRALDAAMALGRGACAGDKT